MRYRIVGRCYLCRAPVRAKDAARVVDWAVSGYLTRRIARLVHAGECETILRGRIGR
jgi:hypothetical protein